MAAATVVVANLVVVPLCAIVVVTQSRNAVAKPMTAVIVAATRAVSLPVAVLRQF